MWSGARDVLIKKKRMDIAKMRTVISKRNFKKHKNEFLNTFKESRRGFHCDFQTALEKQMNGSKRDQPIYRQNRIFNLNDVRFYFKLLINEPNMEFDILSIE